VVDADIGCLAGFCEKNCATDPLTAAVVGFAPGIAAASPDKPFRLGVFGGTFDPPHLGHLLLAEQARQHFALDGVLFVPTGQPPGKSLALRGTAEQRYAMLVAACASNPDFAVSRLELERPGVSYTIDSLRALAAVCQDRAQLFFIVGGDAAADLPKWKDASQLASLASFIVAGRVNTTAAQVAAAKTAGFRLLELEMPLLQISARDIRERVAAGQSVRYLVCQGVWQYIRQSGLYRQATQ